MNAKTNKRNKQKKKNKFNAHVKNYTRLTRKKIQCSKAHFHDA